jgi:putative redox protein
MKATARRAANFTHRIGIREHQIVADEPTKDGGDDQGPSPQELLAASLASCTAITIEMYAERKGWEIGQIAVDCEYEQTPRGSATEFKVTLWLPDGLSEEQLDRLNEIAAKCPVHRTLESEVSITQSIATTARP